MIHIHIWNAICSISWSELVPRCGPPTSSRRWPVESIWLLAFSWPHQYLGSGPGNGSGLGRSIKPNGLRLDLQYNLNFQAVSEGRKKGLVTFSCDTPWQNSLCVRVPPQCDSLGKATKCSDIISHSLRRNPPYHIQSRLQDRNMSLR